MPAQLSALLVPGILLLHGLGHGGAIGALAWIAARPGDPTDGWRAARSWLLPALPGEASTAIACAFWMIALVGFAAAALSLAGLGLPPDAWRPLAAVSAVVSLAGIVLFAGTWPVFNTLAAVVVNLAVLGAFTSGWRSISVWRVATRAGSGCEALGPARRGGPRARFSPHGYPPRSCSLPTASSTRATPSPLRPPNGDGPAWPPYLDHS